MEVEAMKIIMYTLPVYIIWTDRTMFVWMVVGMVVGLVVVVVVLSVVGMVVVIVVVLSVSEMVVVIVVGMVVVIVVVVSVVGVVVVVVVVGMVVVVLVVVVLVVVGVVGMVVVMLVVVVLVVVGMIVVGVVVFVLVVLDLFEFCDIDVVGVVVVVSLDNLLVVTVFGGLAVDAKDSFDGFNLVLGMIGGAAVVDEMILSIVGLIAGIVLGALTGVVFNTVVTTAKGFAVVAVGGFFSLSLTTGFSFVIKVVSLWSMVVGMVVVIAVVFVLALFCLFGSCALIDVSLDNLLVVTVCGGSAVVAKDSLDGFNLVLGMRGGATVVDEMVITLVGLIVVIVLGALTEVIFMTVVTTAKGFAVVAVVGFFGFSVTTVFCFAFNVVSLWIVVVGGDRVVLGALELRIFSSASVQVTLHLFWQF